MINSKHPQLLSSKNSQNCSHQSIFLSVPTTVSPNFLRVLLPWEPNKKPIHEKQLWLDFFKKCMKIECILLHLIIIYNFIIFFKKKRKSSSISCSLTQVNQSHCNLLPSLRNTGDAIGAAARGRVLRLGNFTAMPSGVSFPVCLAPSVACPPSATPVVALSFLWILELIRLA